MKMTPIAEQETRLWRTSDADSGTEEGTAFVAPATTMDMELVNPNEIHHSHSKRNDDGGGCWLKVLYPLPG